MPGNNLLFPEVIEVIEGANALVSCYLEDLPPNRLVQSLFLAAKAGINVTIVIPAVQEGSITSFSAHFFQRCDQYGINVCSCIPSNSIAEFILVDEEWLLSKQAVFTGAPSQWEVKSKSLSAHFAKVFSNLVSAATTTLIKQPTEQKESKSTPLIDFSIRPEVIKAGEPFLIEWEVIGATNISIHPQLGVVPPKGGKVLRCYETTDFELTVQSRVGVRSITRTAEVLHEPQLFFELFALEPDTQAEIKLNAQGKSPVRYGILSGQLLRLYWRSYYSDEVLIGNKKYTDSEGVLDFTVSNSQLFSIKTTGHGKTLRTSVYFDVFTGTTIEKLLPKNLLSGASESLNETIASDLKNLSQQIGIGNNQGSTKSIREKLQKFIKPFKSKK